MSNSFKNRNSVKSGVGGGARPLDSSLFQRAFLAVKFRETFLFLSLINPESSEKFPGRTSPSARRIINRVVTRVWRLLIPVVKWALKILNLEPTHTRKTYSQVKCCFFVVFFFFSADICTRTSTVSNTVQSSLTRLDNFRKILCNIKLSPSRPRIKCLEKPYNNYPKHLACAWFLERYLETIENDRRMERVTGKIISEPLFIYY